MGASAFSEFQFEHLSDAALATFWSELIAQGITSVDVNIATQAGSIEGIAKAWKTSGKGAFGVRLCLVYLLNMWTALSESEITDAAFDLTITTEAEKILSQLRRLKPIPVACTYSIDGVSCNDDKFLI